MCLSVILPETAPNFWRFRDWLQKQNQWPSLCSTCSGQASLAACLAGHPHVMFASVTLQVHLTSLSYCNIWPITFQVLCQSQCKRSSAPSPCGLGPRRSIPDPCAGAGCCPVPELAWLGCTRQLMLFRKFAAVHFRAFGSLLPSRHPRGPGTGDCDNFLRALGRFGSAGPRRRFHLKKPAVTCCHRNRCLG